MKLKLSLLVIGLSMSSAVSAASYYDWTSNGNCYEFTPRGAAIRSVSNSTCRAQVGSRYEWTNNGNCYEFTPNGAAIRSVSNSVCRTQRGSRYEWTNNGNCYEFTPSGRSIRSVSNSVCRSHQGSYYDWTNNGNCYEFTPSGVAIRSVSLSTCRNSNGHVHRPAPSRPSHPRPAPTPTNPHRGFRKNVINLAERIIINVDALEDMANNQEYVEVLQPIKKQAARLSARVQGRVGFKKVKNTLVHLDSLLNAATDFIEETLERDDSFYQAKELLTQRYKIQKLANTMRDVGHNHDNILY